MPNIPPTDRIILIGTDAPAMAALWRLCAAGARIRWFADRTDIGSEAVLAHALGRGCIEVSFDDPVSASLDGAAAIVMSGDDSRDARLSERARASGVPIYFVNAAGLSASTRSELGRTWQPNAVAAARSA